MSIFSGISSFIFKSQKQESTAMDIIIPLGGIGKRFRDGGYAQPKPFIDVLGRPIISYILDYIRARMVDEDELYVVKRGDLGDFDFGPRVNVMNLPKGLHTRGAAETVHIALQEIPRGDRPVLLIDGDTFYKDVDILDMIRSRKRESSLVCIRDDSQEPCFSYSRISQSGRISEIAEKIKITDIANTGAYYFADRGKLYDFSRYENSADLKGEFYTSRVISDMIDAGEEFRPILIQERDVVFLGTPRQVQEYIDTMSLEYIFDLDGTLVSTDRVYLKVWKTLLKEREFTSIDFDEKVKGNDDATALKLLGVGDSGLGGDSRELERISKEKDDLFLEHIDEILIFDGAIDFIRSLKKDVVIVTNSNRRVAERIVEKLNIRVTSIVIGGECKRPKPFPDPYLEAFKRLDKNPKECIIFEDSDVGLRSALAADPLLVVSIEIESHPREYSDVTFSSFAKASKYFSRSLFEITMDARVSRADKTRLQGGYVSDVSAVTVEGVGKCVLKSANANDLAIELDLYSREADFYLHLSKSVPVRVPRLVARIKETSLLLEFLEFDMISTPTNEQALGVVDALARLHSFKIENSKIRSIDGTEFDSWASIVAERWPDVELHMQEFGSQFPMLREIVAGFKDIKSKLSSGDLCLCHGDVKMANLFFDGDEPIFIDWQYVHLGKGVQDLVFFLIESFEPDDLARRGPMLVRRYYSKLQIHQSPEEFAESLKNAACFFPIFVIAWFGSMDPKSLADPTFPSRFLHRLVAFLQRIPSMVHTL